MTAELPTLPTRASKQKSLPSVIESPSETTDTTETHSVSIDEIKESLRRDLAWDNENELCRVYDSLMNILDEKIEKDTVDQSKLMEVCTKFATLTGKPVSDVIDSLPQRMQLRIDRRNYAIVLAKKQQFDEELKVAYENDVDSRRIRDAKIKAAEEEFRNKKVAVSTAESNLRQLDEARRHLFLTCDHPGLLRQRRTLSTKLESEREVAHNNDKALRDAQSSLNRAKANVADMMDGIGHTHHPQTIQNAKDQVEILEQMLPALRAACEKSTKIVDALNAEIEACDEAMTKA